MNAIAQYTQRCGFSRALLQPSARLKPHFHTCCKYFIYVLAMQVTPSLATAAPITLTQTSAAMTPAQRAIPYTASGISLMDRQGGRHNYKLVYHHLFHSDDKIKSGPFKGQWFGGLIGADGRPMMGGKGHGALLSDIPDGNSIMPVSRGHDSAVLKLFTHFEYVSGHYRDYPMFSGISTLEQNLHNGSLQVRFYKKQNYKAVGGVWTPCVATLSAWGSRLSAEENEPDARLWAMGRPRQKTAGLAAMSFMQNYIDQYPAQVSTPYHYGYMVETELDKQGRIGRIIRHYSLGRFSHEKIELMPDQQTAYMSDDRPFGCLFMAVADRPGDLSANTLYAARWEQTSGSDAGAADLRWIRLGHATDAEIRSMIDKGMSFLDLFDTAPVPAIGFVTVRVGRGHSREYLRLKPGMEKAAAFLESRRYAAYLGATSELSSEEGLSFNEADKKLYVAMSKISAGMANDIGQIRLSRIASGAVYELSLGDAPVADQHDHPINSQWVATSMASIAALTGRDRSDKDQWGNTAAIDAIANPDNLSFSPASRYLFIGEDSSKHVNNYLWAYQIDTGELVRLMSVPVGAEIGGLQVVDNLNGFMYVMVDYQHPGGDGPVTSELEQAIEAAAPAFAAGRYRHAGVGYLAIEGITPNQLPWMQQTPSQ